MINNSPIVEDTRKIRYLISLKFDHDINRYIEYLQNAETIRKESYNQSSVTTTSEIHQSNTNDDMKSHDI